MNAAARLVHQGTLSRHLVISHLLNLKQMTLSILVLTVLLSALSIIFVTHTSRVLYATYQRHLTEKNRLYVERGQLLLERSTWMMQADVQRIAERKLGMIIPDHHSVVVIKR